MELIQDKNHDQAPAPVQDHPTESTKSYHVCDLGPCILNRSLESRSACSDICEEALGDLKLHLHLVVQP